jgi:predicted nucleic acid-binding Zn ribbon protein
VQPLHTFSTSVLAEIIRRQPGSPAKTRFVWQLAVGPSLAKATTVDLVDGVLVVRAGDSRWIREIDRARDIILARLQHLLGPNAVSRLDLPIEALDKRK